MGSSRRRKKQSKRKWQKRKVDEVAQIGFLEVTRKGKNVFIKNNATSSEQNEYLQQLKTNLPKAYEEIKQLITEVVNIINQYDKVFILGGISSLAYYKMLTKENDDTSYETLIEYCHSICLASENSNSGKLPTSAALERIFNLLLKIREYYISYYTFERANEKYSEVEFAVRRNMITETIVVRGIGYMTHIKELFKEMFQPHDLLFETTYGFKSYDLIETFEKLEESFGCRVMMPDGSTHFAQQTKMRIWMEKYGKNLKKEDIESGRYLIQFGKDNPEIIIENNGVVLYQLNSIDTYKLLYEIRHYNEVQKRVVESLALNFGENILFTKPEKYKYEILNESKIFACPIVFENNKYYLFAMNLAARNLFNIAQVLIKKADNNYYQRSFLGNRSSKTKDNFIEKKVLYLFKKMLPNVNFKSNVIYNYKEPAIDIKCAKAEQGRYELDLIGVSNNATYLIEVKSGLVSNEARRGAIESIKSDLSEIVGNAICQSYRASSYIESNPNCEFEAADKSTIRPINRDKVFRVSISFSYVGTIISELSKLQEFGIIDANSDFAWAINIFDLFVFSDMIESENDFIEYLEKRLPLYRDKRLAESDELDLLGLYFYDNFKIDKAHAKVDSLRLNGYKDNFDAYYDHSGVKPKRQKR